jgi:RHS repeat-associated protein
MIRATSAVYVCAKCALGSPESEFQPFTVSGWAIDAAAPTGTGVDIIGVNAYHNFGNGSPAYALGGATYGDARPAVAASYGARFLNSGYHFTMTGQPPGWYRFVNYAHSTTSGVWTGRTQDAYVDIPTVSLEINRSGTGTGAIVATGLTCPGGSTAQAMPCGASYTLGSVVWITAVADPGSTFAGWGGGCLGPQPTCGVTLAGDRYTFAYFTKTPDTIATTYYHTDVIGSVRALSDDTGATVIRHDYLPFGEDTQPLTGDPLRFGGKELDPESALMNFEARYYRNTWGRFTQVDPVQAAGALAAPQSWNRYAYARNNPLRFVDPTGLSDTPLFRTLTDQAYREPLDMTNTWKSDDGLGLWAERFGMTASSGDLGPFGCGYKPDSNGNFYRWTETCDLHESQQIYFQAGGGTTKTPTTPTADTPTDAPTNPTPAPRATSQPWSACAVPVFPAGESVNANISLVLSENRYGFEAAFRNTVGRVWNRGTWDYKRRKGPDRYEDAGNFNYGAVMTALGVPAPVTKIGATIAQAIFGGGLKLPYGIPMFVDNPGDQDMIQRGISYMQHCTK